MEMLDIVDENGNPTGEIKERTKVHEDGDLHRTSHVWIIRDNDKGGWDVLLQKRSSNKDSFPGCYTVSSAGHIPAGSDYMESALRELEEELGVKAEAEELKPCRMSRVSIKEVFHGKEFVNNQISRVYRMKRNDLKLEQLKLQEEEVESAIWMDYEECLEAVKNNTINHCISLVDLKSLKDAR